MRVLYVIDGLGPGGAERSLAEMSSHLVQSGIDLQVATLHDREGFLDEVLASGAVVHALAGSSRSGWLHQLVGLVRATRPDIVHTTLFDSDVLGRVAAAARRTPVVSSLVNSQYGDEQRREFDRRWRLAGAQAIDAATARLVRRFHAVSNRVAEDMARRLRVRRDRIDVIPRGRDRRLLGENTPDRGARARAALELDDAMPVVLCVARLDYAKGHDVLLPAWLAVTHRLDNGVLLLAGHDGNRGVELRRLADELGLDNSSVRFLGVRRDIPELLCAADAFVLPSRREGLPGAVLEAMAMAVPIVATDIPATCEAVPGIEYATLVPVDDPVALEEALLVTLADRVSAGARAANARRRFDQEFTIERVSRRMVEFYERAIA